MKKKLFSCILVIIMLLPFICNYTHAADNSIRSKLFFDDLDNNGSTESSFWAFDAGQYSNSSDLLNRVKEAEKKGEYYPQGLEVLVDFILWIKKQNYQELANNNDSNYLEIAKIALKSGEKLLVENGNKRDDETKEEKILSVIGRYSDNKLATNESVAQEMPNLYKDIERQIQRVNAAEDYKKDNSQVNDDYKTKLNYTKGDRVNYLQKYGNRLNLSRR